MSSYAAMNGTFDYPEGVMNLNYTYSFSKYSCFREFYFAHVACCYLVFLSGLACFFTRLHPKIKFLHAWFGRAYIISMLLATASALLINNTGLPGPTLVSFAYTMTALPLAWLVIKIYEYQMNYAVTKKVEEALQNMQSTKQIDLEHMRATELNKILKARSWRQRFFSLKTVHGCLMLLSYFGIAGRIFASNQSGDFQCYTYPVYKPVNTDQYATAGIDLENQPLQLVPVEDPRYERLPWAGNETAWAVRGFFTPLIIGAVVASIWTWCGARKDRKNKIESGTNYCSTSMYTMKNHSKEDVADTPNSSERSGLTGGATTTVGIEAAEHSE